LPFITGISPIIGGTGTPVTITGVNLDQAFNVIIAGLTATVQSNSSTAVVAVITGTSLTTTTGIVRLQTVGGAIASSQNFTYNPAPTISSVTPNTAVANGTDIPIVIRGTNFNLNLNPANGQPQSGVFFSIVGSSQSSAVGISVQSVTPTEIRATISGTLNNQQGQRLITVSNADGQFVTIPFQLTVAQLPTITSITPNSTTATGVAFTAIIRGTNFFGNAGTSISANGTALTFSAISSSQLNVIIPASLNQTGAILNIIVRNSDNNQATTTLTVREAGRPFISQITPPRAVVGSPTLTVTIVGGNFFLNAQVFFENSLLQVLSLKADTAVVVIPASFFNALGTYRVRVRNSNGFEGVSLFNVGYPAPSVVSVVTASGTNPGQSVTAATIFPFQLAINGAGFRQGLTVTFNGVPVRVQTTSDTQIVVQVPAQNQQGVFPVTVLNPDGLSGSGNFIVGAPNGPIITTVTPAVTNATATPFILTINGANFGINTFGQPLAGFTVRFNNIPLQILNGSTTGQVLAFVPAGVNSLEGSAFIQITNPDLQTAQRTIDILCSVCPIISGVTPGTIRQVTQFDQVITINGSNFQQGAIVTLGGTALRISSVQGTQIIAVAPTGFFSANGQIRIINPDSRSFTLPNAIIVGIRDNVMLVPMVGSAYPNPVDDMLTVEVGMTKAAVVRVRMTDILGKSVMSFEQQVGAGTFSRQLDVSGLTSGVYVIEITDGERRFVEKVVKR
jgi:hypothetical protein